MAFTNSTTHYGLPQYVATDIPTILQDVNGAYRDIDTAIYEAKQDADGVAGDLATTNATVAQHTSDIAGLDARVTTNTANITGLTTRVGTAESAINTLDSKMVTAEGDIDNLESAMGDKASTASVTALATRVTTAEGDIDSLETRVGTAESDIDALESGKADASDVTTLAGRVTTAESDIDNIETLLSNKYLLVGEATYTLATGNGSKTLAQLIVEAITALRGKTAEDLECDAFVLKDFYMPVSSASSKGNLQIEDSHPIRTLVGATASFNAFVMSMSSTGLTVTMVHMSDSGAGGFVTTVLASNNAVTDYSSTVIANGVTIDIKYDKYTKVQ